MNISNSSASVDDAQTSHYISPPQYVGDLTEATLYEAYTHANKNNWDALAITSMQGDATYTHRELLNMIDLAAAGFSKLGVNRYSKVGIMLNNSIEEAVALLALNKLGAISVFIDISKSPTDIERCIFKHAPVLLLIDEILLPIEPTINSIDIPIVIANQTKPYYKGITFIDLYKLGVGIETQPIPFEANEPAVIINSSGTTGIPKPIVHTNYSVNMAAFKVLCTDYPLNRTNLIMKIVPSFIGLGLITTLYTSLLSGTHIVLIPGSTPPQSIINTITFASKFPTFRDNIGLNRDAKLLLFAAPMYYRILCDNLDVFEDLSYIGAMLAAGAKMGNDELMAMHAKMAELNCPVRICNGYGQNEMGGAVTLNSNFCNKEGSAGFPVIGTTIRIVDQDTLETLKPNQDGLILEQSGSQFLYYDGLPTETLASTITLPDGSTWFNSKDLGHIDDEGFLFVTGRVSRVLVRFDCKISIDKIEEKIKKHQAVLDCAVIAMRKSDIEEVPIAFISLNDGFSSYSPDTIIEEIQNSSDSLSDMESLAGLYLLSSLPYMKNGKIDYLALEKYTIESRQ